MESSVSIYEDNAFSVELIKAQLAVPTKAKILQLFYHKSYSIDANDSLGQKQKIALPPFVLRAPEEVPLAISLIKEKSEDFQHKFKLTTLPPKQYSDARLAMSILDPEVIKHILSCFTKGKLKEMEDMTKTLTNRHKKRNDTLEKYMAKLDNAPVRVSTPPVFDRTKSSTPVRVSTPPQSEPEEVEEVKIYKKTALVVTGHTTAFRLDSSAVLQHLGDKPSEEELERYKSSRKLKLKAQIRISKIHVSDLSQFQYNIKDMSHPVKDLVQPMQNQSKAVVTQIQKNQSQKRKDEFDFSSGEDDDDDDYRPLKKAKTSSGQMREKERKALDYKVKKGYEKRSSAHETVADIMAQFEPCSKFIVENERTVDKFDCRVCDERVVPKVNQTSKNALTAHYRKAHSMERHYQCAKCDMILPSIDVWFLERHITSTGCKPKGSNGAVKPSLISCEKCGQTFDKNSSYRDHYKKVHTTIFKDYYKKKVECGGCGLKFTTQSMLSLHEVYEQKLCKVPCSVCKEVIEVKLNCKLEKVFKESGLVDSVKCKKCS